MEFIRGKTMQISSKSFKVSWS